MFLHMQTVHSTDKENIQIWSEFLQAFFKEFNNNKVKWRKMILLTSTSSRLYLEKRKNELGQ